jgi:hypothetical protein
MKKNDPGPIHDLAEWQDGYDAAVREFTDVTHTMASEGKYQIERYSVYERYTPRWWSEVLKAIWEVRNR